MQPRLRFTIPLFTLTRVIMHTGYRMIYPFLTVFARGMGVELGAVSLALTAHNAAGILGPFLAFIADVRGRKVGMLIGLSIFIFGVGLVALFPGYPAFFTSLVLIALGIAVFLPSMHAFIGDKVAYERRGFAIALTELSWSSSFIVGMPVVALLIARLGWVSPFQALALFGLGCAALLAWQLPADRPTNAQSAGWLSSFQKVFSYGPALAGLGFAFLITLGNEVVNLVFGIWMEDSFGLQIAALGAASMVIGLAELGGESLSGAFVDRIGKTRAVQLGLGLNMAAAAMFPLLGHQVFSALVALFLFYLTFEFAIVCSLPLMTEVMPQARGSFMAVMSAALAGGRTLGALLGTPIYQQWGMTANAAFSLGIDVLALVVLTRLKAGRAVPESQASENMR